MGVTCNTWFLVVKPGVKVELHVHEVEVGSVTTDALTPVSSVRNYWGYKPVGTVSMEWHAILVVPECQMPRQK